MGVVCIFISSNDICHKLPHILRTGGARSLRRFIIDDVADLRQCYEHYHFMDSTKCDGAGLHHLREDMATLAIDEGQQCDQFGEPRRVRLNLGSEPKISPNACPSSMATKCSLLYDSFHSKEMVAMQEFWSR